MIFKHSPEHFKNFLGRFAVTSLWLVLLTVGINLILNIGSILSGQGLPPLAIVITLIMLALTLGLIFFSGMKAWKKEKNKTLKIEGQKLTIETPGSSVEIKPKEINRLTLQVLPDQTVFRIFIETAEQKIVLIEYEDMDKIASKLEAMVEDETKIFRQTKRFSGMGPLFLFVFLAALLLVFAGILYLGISMGVGALIWPGCLLLSGLLNFLRPKTVSVDGKTNDRRGVGILFLVMGVIVLCWKLPEAHLTMPNMAFFHTSTPFLMKVDKLYYSLYREGVKNIQCDISTDRLEGFQKNLGKKYGSKNPGVQSLSSVRYQMKYATNGSIDCEFMGYRNTGNQVLDDEVHKMLENTRKTIKDFWTLYSGFAVVPLFDPRRQYDVKNTGSGYEVKILNSGMTETYSLDSQYYVTQFVLGLSGSGISLDTVFDPSDKGLLIKSWDIELSKFLKSRWEIEYQSVGGHQLPNEVMEKSVVIKGSKTINLNDHFYFSNYQFN